MTHHCLPRPASRGLLRGAPVILALLLPAAILTGAENAAGLRPAPPPPPRSRPTPCC